VINRLTTMNNLRQSEIPEQLEDFASALSGFSEPIIDRACHNIEITDPESHHPTFPALGLLLDECRAAAQIIRDESTTWSLSRYKDCLMFDRYLNDITSPDPKHPNIKPKTQQEVCDAHPSMSYAWIAWKNQKAAGTLICPQWCDYCEGGRYLVTVDENGDRWARRCPHCRSANA
jgi:hypothetical protein